MLTNTEDLSQRIRLVDGLSNSSGRVEVFIDGRWGTVSDNHWDLADAKVACRQLGFKTAIFATKRAFFGEGSDLIWMDHLQCTGKETSLLECRQLPLGRHFSRHSKDAGVVCGGKKKCLPLSKLRMNNLLEMR